MPECPECARYIRGQTCTCGWTAKVPEPLLQNMKLCDRCSDTSPSVSAFHPDDPEADPQDRGVRLCPSCWIPALRRRAARCIHGELCVRCQAEIALDMAEFRDHLAKVEARSLHL